MALNIKNLEVEQLASQIARATGETKTEAIRKALEERRDRLALPSVADRIAEMKKYLDEFHQGRTYPPVTKEEWDALFE